MLNVRRGFVGAITVVAALAVASVAAGDATNSDPAGDATGGAPDITQVAVSNDASGVLAFKVTTVAPLIDSALMIVELDSDANPSTGGGGVEYALLAGTGGAAAIKWSGSAWASASAPSLTMTRSGNVLTFTVNRSDVGIADRFGYDVVSVNYDANDNYLGEDDVPDGGAYTYTLSFPQCANGKDDDGDGKVDGNDLGCSSPTDNNEADDPVTLKAGKASVAPAKPKAGAPVVVSVPVTRVETGTGITSGTVRCVGHVGAKTLRSVGKVAGGKASCALSTPKTGKGKRLTGQVTVVVLGRTASAPFSVKLS